MIIQLESSNMFCKKESWKRMCDCNRGGVEGCSNRAQKTHSFERTHILDSKVTLTHHERNDAGRERREEREKEEKSSEEKNSSKLETV